MNDAELSSLLAARTLELCGIPSVTGQEEALAEHFERWGRKLFSPDRVCRVGHTLVFGNPGVDDRPSIGLFGHLDTVPPHPGDPAPHIDHDNVVGLGASDMKGALALMQVLAEQVNHASLPFNLVYVMYEREEGPYVENGLGPLFAAREDLTRLAFAICLEPSDNKIQMGCCGTLHARLTFHGKSAHSARPWQGENAIHKAGPFLTKLLHPPPHEVTLHGHRFREVMNATMAQAGRARNVIPEAMTINVNYRFAPNRTLEDAQEQIRKMVGGEASVEFIDLAPAGAVFDDHPLLRRLQERTGAAIESKQAWTDVARLGSHGIPAVNFGPGQSDQAHQASERASLSRLVEGYRLMERFLEK